MERIIHFTIPERITGVQAQTIERARSLHPTWRVEVWQDPVEPAGYFLERYWSKANSGAQFADLLRLDLVYKWGGIYLDSDLILLKPLDDLARSYEFFVASEDGKNLTNAVIGARQAHPALRELIEDLLKSEPDWSLPPNITTGPLLFARVLKSNSDVAILPRETFYSYNWDETHARRTHRHSVGQHLWAASWKTQQGEASEAPRRSFGWKSIARPFVKPAFMAATRLWYRIRSSEGGLHGFCNSAAANFLNLVLRGGDWMLDAGANAGLLSLVAAKNVGSFGRVFAYEPNLDKRELLWKTAVRSRMHERIIVRPVAVGEIAGDVRLSFTPERFENAQMKLSLGESIEAAGGVDLTDTNVSCVTLNHEFPVDLPIKVLRIGIQGLENAILKGASRLLERRCVDFVLIELSRNAEPRWSELLAQLKRLTEANYVACTLEKDGRLIDHKSVASALDRMKDRNIVLMARDQYRVNVDGLSVPEFAHQGR